MRCSLVGFVVVEVPSVSDIDPSEVTVGRRTTPDKFTSEHSDAAAGAAGLRSEREGLPSTYRMRADAHYVDQLASRRERVDRADRLDAPRQSAGLVDVSDRETPLERRDRRSDRVMAQLAEEIAAIASAAATLADRSPLVRRMGADLVRAQAWRASWLLDASALIDGRHRGQWRSKAMSQIVEHLRQGLSPECRLAGATIDLQATDWNTPVTVDEPALVAAVTGAVYGTLNLGASTEGMRIRVAFEAAGGELRQVEVAQDDATAAPGSNLRFFDASWSDRPGGWSAGLAALAVRGAAQQLGGSAVFIPGERRGTTIRLNLAPRGL